jgi:hypothetical protein
MSELQAETEKIRQVRRIHERDLMSKANVVGLGIGYRQQGGKRSDELALVVMVKKKLPGAQLSPQDMIPSSIDGVPVDVQEIGEIKAY